jgi:hypothetical protein
MFFIVQMGDKNYEGEFPDMPPEIMAKKKNDTKNQTQVTRPNTGIIWAVHDDLFDYMKPVGNIALKCPLAIDVIEDTLYVIDQYALLYKIDINTSATFSKHQLIDIDTSFWSYPSPVFFSSCKDSNNFIYYLCDIGDSNLTPPKYEYRKILKYDYRTNNSSLLNLPSSTTQKIQGFCYDKIDNRLVCVTAEIDTSRVIGISLDSLLTTNVLYKEKVNRDMSGVFLNIYMDSTNAFIIGSTGFVYPFRNLGDSITIARSEYAEIRKYSRNFIPDPKLIADLGMNDQIKNFYYSGEKNIFLLMKRKEIKWSYLSISPPSLLYPENNSIDISTSTWLKWHDNPQCRYYYLQLATDSLFTNIIKNEELENEYGSYMLENLDHNRKYYWKMMSLGNGMLPKNFTDWSAVYSFTTGNSDISGPTLISPPDSTLIDFSATFKWDSIAGADGYYLNYHSHRYPQNVTIYTTSTTYTIDEIRGLDKYYINWRVKGAKGSNNAPYTNWSNERTLGFKTGRLNYPLIFYYDMDSVFIQRFGSNVEMMWDSVPGAKSYTIKYKKFWEKEYTHIYNLDSCSLFIDSLELNTLYEFSVRSYNDSLQSYWNRYKVCTWIEDAPPPLLIVPYNGDNTVKQKPNFIWKGKGLKKFNLDIIEYGSEIPKEGSLDLKSGSSIPSFLFNPTISERFLKDTIFKPTQNLKDRTVYLWRVKSMTDSASSEWSKAQYFSTNFATDVDDNSAFSDEITISPNPCENTALVQIKADIPQGSKYTMSIMNYLGQIVEERDLGTISNDNKVIPITTTHLPPGSYYIVLSDGKSRLKPSIFSVIR